MFKTHKPRNWIILTGFLCALGISVCGWFIAGNTPRDGWSLIAIHTGLTQSHDSRDRGYFVAGYGGQPAVLDLSEFGLADNEQIMVGVQRARHGLFIPWREKNDLRILVFSGKKPYWVSGTNDPAWSGVLAVARDWYEQQHTPWHQTVVAGIDSELAGRYPNHDILLGALVLELIVVLAHIVLLAFVLVSLHLALRSYFEPRTLQIGLLTNE